VEWVWSLLDDGIESFRTAEYLDEQLIIATRVASLRGHAMADVILCCKADGIDSTRLSQ
jgi:hypothetical protein